jgi:hypothetical protein
MEKLKENQFIPVGKKVKVGFKIFKVVESTDSLSCIKCSLYQTGICSHYRNFIFGECDSINRPDGKEVYFVECYE